MVETAVKERQQVDRRSPENQGPRFCQSEKINQQSNALPHQGLGDIRYNSGVDKGLQLMRGGMVSLIERR